MTARTRRRWQPEEKLAVIKEVQEKGSVVETCRKYSIDPAMYYRWKASYDTFGVDGLKSHYLGKKLQLQEVVEDELKTQETCCRKSLWSDSDNCVLSSLWLSLVSINFLIH